MRKSQMNIICINYSNSVIYVLSKCQCLKLVLRIVPFLSIKLTKFTNFALVVLFIALPPEPFYLDQLTFDLNLIFPHKFLVQMYVFDQKLAPLSFIALYLPFCSLRLGEIDSLCLYFSLQQAMGFVRLGLQQINRQVCFIL